MNAHENKEPMQDYVHEMYTKNARLSSWIEFYSKLASPDKGNTSSVDMPNSN